MKFDISKEHFLEALADISNIVARKTTKPILSHALIQASSGSLLLKGTDTEVTLQILLHELNIQEEGAVTVPAGKLLDVVRHLPAQATVYCSLDKEQLLVKAAGSVFRIATLPAEDFPALAEADMDGHIEIQSRALHDIMQKVRFSMANEDVRYYLNGMYLNIVEDGQAIHAVSTDGHRLSCARSGLDTAATAGTNLIVPKKGVNELIRQLARVSQPVVLNLGERQLSLTIGGTRLTSQLIDGNFPNYEQVLPSAQENPVLVSRQAFLDSLQRAKVLLLDRHDGIRLGFAGTRLQLSARNLENETVEEALDIINPQNLELEAALNINYLIDAISTISGDNVQLHFTDKNSPCLITSSEDEGVRYIIMPMRL